jgi:hypothetical protein
MQKQVENNLHMEKELVGAKGVARIPDLFKSTSSCSVDNVSER